MWGAFVTGFAERASIEIEKTNKEISDRVLAEMSSLIKKKEEAEETAETKRDTARKQAQALRELSGNKLTDTQIVGIINGTQADSIIKQLQDRQVGPERLKQLFIPADPNAQADLEQYLSEVGKLTGQAPVRTEMERGAFGLRSRAGEAARARGLAAAGMTEEELYQTRMARPEGVEGTLNLSALAESETTEKLKIKMRDIISRNFANEDDEKQFDTLRKQIEAAAIVKGMFAFEEQKPRTTSEINSILQRSLREGLDPYIISGVAQVMQSGDVEPITGDPEDIANFRKSKNSIIREIAINRGLLDPRTNKVLNEQAEDALTPYAVIEDGKIVNWKTAAPGSTAKPGGGGSAGAKPAGVPSPATPPDPTVVQYINKDGEPKTKKFETKEDADEFYRKWSAGGGKFWRRSGNELIVN